MSAIQGVGVTAPSSTQAALAANLQAAGRTAATAAPRVAFRTLLLDRGLAVADAGLHTPPASPLMGPAAVAPPSTASRATHGAALLESNRSVDDDSGAGLAGSGPAHRRPGEADLEAPLAIPPPIVMPPPFTSAAPSPGAESARAATSLEDLLPALVRRIAWSGDGQRGSVRLELGAGELAGATLLVHADAGRVSVHMDVPPGTDAALWEQRLRERLAARGLATDAVEVT